MSTTSIAWLLDVTKKRALTAAYRILVIVCFVIRLLPGSSILGESSRFPGANEAYGGGFFLGSFGAGNDFVLFKPPPYNSPEKAASRAWAICQSFNVFTVRSEPTPMAHYLWAADRGAIWPEVRSPLGIAARTHRVASIDRCGATGLSRVMILIDRF